MLTLKPYQEQCLEALQAYLALAGQVGVKAAFVLRTERPYKAVPHLPELPYVCIRVPTGGGKTFMACHALHAAARELLQQDRAVCLWLVPSNAIRAQTLKALRDRAHPYRAALDAAFRGNVAVMDLAEALYVQRGTLEGDTAIIVSTLAALRVQDKEGRKIYEQAGALQHHFSDLPAEALAGLEKFDGGPVIPSLANVLRLWKPVVIMDEAHKARTKLSFETLARFDPCCIIEFTATPETEHDPEHGRFASNVLVSVSAAQLKAARMIKLPIRLHTRPGWRDVLGDAVVMQRELEKVALAEKADRGEYIRPIVLIQAEKHSRKQKTATAEVVKDTLLNLKDGQVPADQIAVATGAAREIEGVDLFSEACPVRFIITQQALKEGWDCSFAYVFCSVADIGTARDVEQFVGRVLRLPRAEEKRHGELNRAYAMVSSPKTADTMAALNEAMVVVTEALEDNGFDAREARDFVQTDQPRLPGMGPLFGLPELSVAVAEAPDLSKLAGELRKRVKFDENAGTLAVIGPLTAAERDELGRCFGGEAGKRAVQKLYAASIGAAEGQVPPMHVPALCVRVDGQLEMFEESHFLDAQWDLHNCDAALAETEFPSEIVDGADGEVDISEAGRVQTRYIGQVRKQLILLRRDSGWSMGKLVSEIDRAISHVDIPLAQSVPFITRAIDRLIRQRGVTVDQLAAQRGRLAAAVAGLMDRHRKAMRKAGYQRLLLGPKDKVFAVDPAIYYLIAQDRYAPNWYYEGAYAFQRAALRVGELKAEGEEFECARHIDQLPQVKRWVRNLAGPGREDGSVWLQTSTDKFYPDFVAELLDGRFLVVEYKNAREWSDEDSLEKRTLGEFWAERSGGRIIFVMPQGISDLGAIDRAIAVPSAGGP